MSNIYIQEPPTNGKVLLQTSVGDIDIELWAKETPKACRNFIQLCLEDYYNGTIFHRLVPGFIVQGGDPNGDGTGGESIYGQPFKDEFHSRLRFVRRGLVAMANAGKDDNGSQFFFTLASSPELQNKHTIFGKVTGNTLYNMLKLEEGLTDKDDRPLYPHKIISTQVLANPFPDIVPRVTSDQNKETASVKPKEKVKKNLKLLSFGEEAEEDEVEMEAANEVYRGQSKSSHDLTNDPRLSSVPAIDNRDQEGFDKVTDGAVLEHVRKKFKQAVDGKIDSGDVRKKDAENLESNGKDKSKDERDEVRRQIKQLKRELNKKKIEKNVVPEENIEKEPIKEENDVLEKYHKNLAKYKANPVSRKGTSEREQQTLKLFEKFKTSLETAKGSRKEEDNEISDTEEDDNASWLTHLLKAEGEKVVLAKDANIPNEDRYDLSDPRNPINQRRRDEKKSKRDKK